METSPCEIALIAGGFTVIGVLLGAWIGYRSALKLNKITDFNKAAVDFQSAFLEARQQLRDDPKADWDSILNSNVLLAHEKAAMRFRLFLPVEDRKAFDTAWNTYFFHRPHPGDRYPPEKQPVEYNDEENCKIFIEQINALLMYAKLK